MTRRITVLGAGVMGTGITTLALAHGIPVTLVDLETAVLDRARASVGRQLRHAQLLGAAPDVPPGELTTSTSAADCAGSIAVIEAISEHAEQKDKILREVSGIVDPGTVIVSNTSGIPIDELAASVERPDELVGIHFMNPPYLITMVEIARGPRTSDRTMESVRDLLNLVNRRGIAVRDAPGFVTSRLLHPMINNAARIVGEGVADAAEVDELMAGCLGHPTGPLRTADLIGLDNLADSLFALHERLGDPQFLPCEQLLDHVRAGRLGRKSGSGFYEYEEITR
ncbi:3-hydroxyacyl-CoA dehydrogenase family protein [Actinophytocola gossypii]|uniref:3-hydroxyacyl-CoA dehydrogenase family protein n=1 Tax=Actinophytocola gossypii TaxID=2812003 RepID=A0ABT2JKK5_9PSEU|nr:3-hydroxyacyl-CoA dehydrogenase family protein [Actinophytocola gossypii]MCT2588316.1 3-hydroxyacyl-CoA dehydrogenase family protein [Actinophytocola gossypii]